MEDKLFFILVYQKTNPLQTMHGLEYREDEAFVNLSAKKMLNKPHEVADKTGILTIPPCGTLFC